MYKFSFALVLTAAMMTAPAVLVAQNRPEFEPNWDSLNARAIPGWFAQAKFGIFIHWGVYSVPSFCDTSTYAEWYQHWLKTNSHGGLVRKFHQKNFGKDFEYRDFAPMFKAELWQPDDWAELFERAGAKYVVLVSKHHDGFALWPNEQAGKTRGYKWNSIQTGPRRDLCGDLTEAVRKRGLKMGFYYSFMEWENPLYDTDKTRYVEDHMIPQIKDLVTRYKPAIFWPDGEWDHPDALWRSPEILAWMYNHVDNPDEFVVNDRWGHAMRGQTGDFYTTEYGDVGGGSPGLKDPDKPFEECRGIGHSFAYNRLENYDRYLSREKLVRMFIDLVSKGGNLLLNLGPTADGRIPVIQQDRLIALGEWLKINGEAIYGTRKSLFKSLPWGASTTKGNTIYLHVYDWPNDHTLEVPGLETQITKAYLLHDPNQTALKLSGNGTGSLTIDLLGFHPFQHASVIALQCDQRPRLTSSRDNAAGGQASGWLVRRR
jgi:alpha-L-fucosidase